MISKPLTGTAFGILAATLVVTGCSGQRRYVPGDRYRDDLGGGRRYVHPRRGPVTATGPISASPRR